MQTDTDTVTLPFLTLTDEQWATLLFAEEAHKFRMVRKAFDGLNVPEPPEGSPWLDNALRLWCWLVIQHNELPPAPDPDKFGQLIGWGIDLSMASSDVTRFIWVIS